MNITRTLVAAVAALVGSEALAQPTVTAFTYQGELQDNGSPASGLHDVRFRLYDAANAGTQLGSTLCIDNVSLVNGRFLVQLDFGSQFASPGRFLELDVRADTGSACNDSSGFVTLAPRQAITSAPSASFAQAAGTATIASNAANLNGQPASFYQAASNLTGTLADARLSTNVPRLNTANTFTNGVSAPTFTGALIGNATTATTATTANNATNLNGQPASFYSDATNLSTGLLADARLSSNIARLNSANVFGSNSTFNGFATFANTTTFNGAVTMQGVGGLAVGEPAGGLLMLQFNGASAIPTLRVAGIGPNSTQGLNFATPGANLAMRLSNAGDLGIGTTTPEARLHVLDGSAGVIAASTSTSAIFERGAANYVQIVSPAASERGVAFGSPNGNFLAGMYYSEGVGMSLRTGTNDTRISIADTGNVGIGTSIPSEKLHVAGNVQVDGTIAISPQVRTISLHDSAFVPERSSTTYSRVGGLQATTTDTFTTPLNLPDGAEIIRLTALYFDSSTSNISVRLQRQVIATGSTFQMATTSSAGGPTNDSFTSTTTTISNPIVDNAANAYLVDAFISSTAPGTTLALYAVQVQYRITSPLP